MEATQSPHRASSPARHRWFQYRLRTLLLGALLLSVALSWLAVKVQQGRRQHEAVVLIEKRGARIAWTDPVPRGLGWLEDLAGKDCFRSIAMVGAGDTGFTDTDMVVFDILPAVNWLELDRTHVSDVGLRHVKDLRRLELLSLADTQVTDAGLVHLARLTKLVHLSLCGTRITDRGLEHLKGLHRLHSLSLDDTEVTHSGVKELQQALPGCKIGR